MSRRDLSRGNKGLWQRIEALWRSMLPRQARVTRADGGSVWVRFVDEDTDAPESNFPSTVSGVPAGTMGWVITLGGRKGLFVATGITRPVIARGIGPSTIVATTAGKYWNDAASFTVSGLIPSYTYTVKCDIEIRTSGSGVRYFSQVARAVGTTTVEVSGNQGKYHRNDGDATMASNVIYVQPDSSGDIVFTPGILYLSGTVSVSSTALTVTLV